MRPRTSQRPAKSGAVYNFLNHADAFTQTGDIIVLERISFQLANNRARYTHFIHNDGTIAALSKLEDLHEARVGVMVESDFPTEAQYEAIELLASYAVGENPAIITTFEEATAPFAARFPPGHIMNTYLEMTEGV